MSPWVGRSAVKNRSGLVRKRVVRVGSTTRQERALSLTCLCRAGPQAPPWSTARRSAGHDRSPITESTRTDMATGRRSKEGLSTKSDDTHNRPDSDMAPRPLSSLASTAPIANPLRSHTGFQGANNQSYTAGCSVPYDTWSYHPRRAAPPAHPPRPTGSVAPGR
jgi:hypothetical protein